MPFSFKWEVKYEINKSYSPLQDASFKKELYNMLNPNFIYKYPDGTLQGTPFDGIKLYDAPGYFFIKFQHEKKCFFMISAEEMDKLYESGTKLIYPEMLTRVNL